MQGILGRVSEQRAGQYLAYTFFRVAPEWRRLPEHERTAAKEAFAEVLEAFAPRFDYLAAYYGRNADGTPVPAPPPDPAAAGFGMAATAGT